MMARKKGKNDRAAFLFVDLVSIGIAAFGFLLFSPDRRIIVLAGVITIVVVIIIGAYLLFEKV